MYQPVGGSALVGGEFPRRSVAPATGGYSYSRTGNRGAEFAAGRDERRGMSTSIIIVVVVVILVLALLGTAIAFFGRGRQRRALQEQFGPEYERTVRVNGDRRQAEADLQNRLQQRTELAIKPLSPAERDQFQQEWRGVQAEFVDAPGTALAQADSLITRVMIARGYPVQDFEEQADIVSVDHPTVVQHYRTAHGIYVDSHARLVTTDEMRDALVSFRSLFSDLVEDNRTDTGTSRSRTASPSPN
jgi:hypothetical protein